MMAFIKLGIVDQIVACNFTRVKYDYLRKKCKIYIPKKLSDLIIVKR